MPINTAQMQRIFAALGPILPFPPEKEESEAVKLHSQQYVKSFKFQFVILFTTHPVILSKRSAPKDPFYIVIEYGFFASAALRSE